MLVHIVHHGELYLVIVCRLGGHLGRAFLQIQAIALVIDDLRPVVLLDDSLAHNSVSVSCPRLESGYGNLVECAYRLPAETSLVIEPGPFHIVEIRAV